MPQDHAKDTDTPTGERIDVDACGALQNWATKFDVTPEQLEEAVKTVGPLAADVEMHLKGSRATTNADREARAEAVDAKKPS